MGKKSPWVLTAIWAAVLCVCGTAILRINFSGNPLYFCSDMYTDMLYAGEVWLNKSIFPEGWVYGNQLYAVATPVLAALFFGITGNYLVSMAIASSLMAFGVMASFFYMVRPLFPHLHERLAAGAAFMVLVLYCGGPVEYFNGWQLFFTMCTYYACYAITIFLAVGCYLRRKKPLTAGFRVLLVLVCLLSFGTGIQSLRQTAVMVLPMIALVVVEWLYCLLTRKPHPVRGTVMVGAFSLANGAGLVCGALAQVEKNEIFGNFRFGFTESLGANLASCFHTCFSLFSQMSPILLGTAAVFLLVCVWLVWMLTRKGDLTEEPLFLCLLLCVISTMAILAIDFLTTMEVRHIYYFLLFPMYAVVFGGLYARLPRLRLLLTAGILVVFTACCFWHGEILFGPEEPNPLTQVSDCLEEEGIETLFAGWNVGEKAAIASDFRIQAAFWGTEEQVFQSVKYLCNPVIFDVEPENCAYLVQGIELASAEALAREQGVELELLRYFPELDYYLFTADTLLMN